MKRSEMLAIIAETLDKTDLVSMEGHKIDDPEYYADLVLGVIQKAGMLPPTIADSTSWDCFANKWEEEECDGTKLCKHYV